MCSYRTNFGEDMWSINNNTDGACDSDNEKDIE